MYEKHEFHIDSGDEKCLKLESLISKHACDHDLPLTASAVQFMQERFEYAKESDPSKTSQARLLGIRFHSLITAEYLINLHPVLSKKENDMVLASALCHPLFELIDDDDVRKAMLLKRFSGESVYQVMMDSAVFLDRSAEEKKAYYHDLLHKKLAFLLRLTERASFVEQVFELPFADANSYVSETRFVYFPLCIDGKELYSELEPVIDVLMEKMRCLIDITDILSLRFQQKETELMKDILALKEENARIRRAMMQIRSENE